MSTLARLPWDLNQVRPEVTSGLVTVAAEGCLEFVKCTEPENRTAAVECCYGTPKRTQASRTPLCISERRTSPLQYRTDTLKRSKYGSLSCVRVDEPETLKSCIIPAGLDYSVGENVGHTKSQGSQATGVQVRAACPGMYSDFWLRENAVSEVCCKQ